MVKVVTVLLNERLTPLALLMVKLLGPLDAGNMAAVAVKAAIPLVAFPYCKVVGAVPYTKVPPLIGVVATVLIINEPFVGTVKVPVKFMP